MSHHEDRIRLRHMLDHAREALTMVNGRSRSDLDTDRQLNLALVRLLEIVGEAANRVLTETRDRHPEIPCFLNSIQDPAQHCWSASANGRLQ